LKITTLAGSRSSPFSEPPKAGYYNETLRRREYRNGSLQRDRISRHRCYRTSYAATTREFSLLPESHDLSKLERDKGYKETPPQQRQNAAIFITPICWKAASASRSCASSESMVPCFRDSCCFSRGTSPATFSRGSTSRVKTGCHEDGYNDIRQDNGSSNTTRKTAEMISSLILRHSRIQHP
jgi:hypothetical protein